MSHRIKRIILRAAVAVIALAYFGYGIVEPQTAAGHATFYLGYSFPPTRPALLRFYTWSLRRCNGGYLPGTFDGFLAGRLWECRGTAEWRAIIDFQIAQGSGRWGYELAQVHDELKRDIISDLLRRLDTFQPQQAMKSLLFIESLRRSDPLHKGGFKGLTPERLDLAKERVREWWSDGSSWPANKTTDPFRDTGMSVYHGPE